MNSFKTNAIYILIIALLVVILYETCKKKNVHTSTSSSDTTTQIHYVYYKDSGISKPIFIKGGRDTIFENSTEYIPSEDYNELVKQFKELKEILLSRNIYMDSLHLDSLGWVKITDTLQKNSIVGRSYVKNIRIPDRTRTITNTIYLPKRRQIYVGVGAFFNPKLNNNTIFGNNIYSGMTSLTGGFLYKSKTDQIIGANAQWDGKQINYGLSTYLKIRLKKN